MIIYTPCKDCIHIGVCKHESVVDGIANNFSKQNLFTDVEDITKIGLKIAVSCERFRRSAKEIDYRDSGRIRR